VAEGALIVLSELVTNAVMHTATDAVVVATFDDHRLRFEVHDGDPRGPVAVAGAAAGGFGLTIVAALCDAWGWEPSAVLTRAAGPSRTRRSRHGYRIVTKRRLFVTVGG
jgi:anti-sigma regulatory factor (Ser/Thr protein kinase)